MRVVERTAVHRLVDVTAKTSVKVALVDHLILGRLLMENKMSSLTLVMPSLVLELVDLILEMNSLILKMISLSLKVGSLVLSLQASTVGWRFHMVAQKVIMRIIRLTVVLVRYLHWLRRVRSVCTDVIHLISVGYCLEPVT